MKHVESEDSAALPSTPSPQSFEDWFERNYYTVDPVARASMKAAWIAGQNARESVPSTPSPTILKPEFVTSAGMIFLTFKRVLKRLKELHAEHVTSEEFGCRRCDVCSDIVQGNFIERAYDDHPDVQPSPVPIEELGVPSTPVETSEKVKEGQ